MPINLETLSTAATSVSALSGLAMVNPQKNVGYQPQPKKQQDGTIPQQPPKFLFNYEGENNVTLQSDITDHYVEDNTAINDHIALSPERIKVQGFIGELNDVVPETRVDLKLLQEKLTTLSPYTPELTVAALRAYNTAFQGYQAFNAAENTFVSTAASINGEGGLNTITGSESPEELAALRARTKNQNKQQIAFQQFYGYWRARTLFTVQTPWAIFKNMSIESLTALQDAETEQLSSFEITFKIIRFSDTNIVGNENNVNLQNRLFDQSFGVVDKGVISTQTSSNLLTRLPA